MTTGACLAAVMAVTVLAMMAMSCARSSGNERVVLPPTTVLSIRSTWAVVKSPLLRIRDQPTGQATVLAHIRMGAVVEIIGKSDKQDTVENESAFWYRVNYEGLKGWVFGTYISIFDTRSKAEAFAASLK
ncbi:MAG TPA: SH3 domain-containing protein [Spirochaetia bacterium]|nr:SH3 domain-containing protein [Spirochaetia bacterium]